jgi:hypothetical protein
MATSEFELATHSAGPAAQARSRKFGQFDLIPFDYSKVPAALSTEAMT